MKITWLYLIKSRISCGLASWNLESIIRVVTSRSRQHINVGVFGVCDWINMQPTGSLIYLYTKISSIISGVKSDLTKLSDPCWQTAEVKQWNKNSRVSWTSWSSLSQPPPWKSRPKNGRQKPLCLFFCGCCMFDSVRRKQGSCPASISEITAWACGIHSRFVLQTKSSSKAAPRSGNTPRKTDFILTFNHSGWEKNASVLFTAETVSPAGTFKNLHS